MNLKEKDGFNFGRTTFLGTGQEDQLPRRLLVLRLSESPDELMLAETEWVIFAGCSLSLQI